MELVLQLEDQVILKFQEFFTTSDV